MERMVVDCNGVGSSLPHMWSRCVGAGRACEGLRSEWQRQLKQVAQECGFQYIRFHGLLAEDMFVYREVNGIPQYNWAYIDSLFDFLLETGIRPFVEFGFMPPDLASGEGTQFWWRGNATPPKDYQKWADLLYALVSHWKERYGLDEIRTWYYEVWNEPNLHAFWHGTKSEYFALYKASARAVKSVDSQLRVGGPATSNFVPDERFNGETEDVSKHLTHRVDDLDSLDWHGVWITDFLEYCAREELPVDFISTHPYPTDFALDGQSDMKGRSRCVDSLKSDLVWLRGIISQSAYPHVEIHLTEWSSSPTSRDYSHDYLPAADYIVKSNLGCAGLADSLSYWVFTDIFEEAGGGPEAFHGGFGLLTMHGIKKPSYWAYRFLNQLGNEMVARGENWIITRDGCKIQGLFYHYPPEMRQAVPISEYPDHCQAEEIQALGEPKPVRLKLTGLKAGAAFTVERLTRENTPTFLWAKMGYPRNLTKGQEQALRHTGPSVTYLTADQTGNLELELVMEPWEITLLRTV